jgi:hypothetical protein
MLFAPKEKGQGGRVCDYSRARRHRCGRCDALAQTQNRQHIQHHQHFHPVTSP